MWQEVGWQGGQGGEGLGDGGEARSRGGLAPGLLPPGQVPTAPSPLQQHGLLSLQHPHILPQQGPAHSSALLQHWGPGLIPLHGPAAASWPLPGWGLARALMGLQ